MRATLLHKLGPARWTSFAQVAIVGVVRGSTALLAVAGSLALHAAAVFVVARIVPEERRLPVAEKEAVAVAPVPFTPVSSDERGAQSELTPVEARAARAERATKKRIPGVERSRGPEASDAETQRRAELEASRALPGGGVTVERSTDLPGLAVLPPPPSIIDPGTLPDPRTDEERETGIDQIRPSGGGSYIVKHGAARAYIAHDGTLTVERPGALENAVAAVGGLLFLDPLPLYYAISGENPGAIDEVIILERTRELRAELCERATEETLKASLLEVRPLLDQIWKKSEPAKERRAQIFRFWDGCVEDGDEAVTRTAAAAREIIVEFIQERLPPDSPEAYREDELRALNASRTSRQTFEPYALAN